MIILPSTGSLSFKIRTGTFREICIFQSEKCRKHLQTEPIQPGITGQNILSAVTVYIFEGRAKRARDVYWAKYNGDSPDDPDNPDNPDDPVTKKYTIKYVLYDGGK